MSDQRERAYRLEHLVTRKEVILLREMAIANRVSFPELVGNVFRVGLREVEIFGIGDVPSPLRHFRDWLASQEGKVAPKPDKCVRLVQEMFFLWSPASLRDLMDGVRDIEDQKNRATYTSVLAWWCEYCDTHDVSPTLLVDRGARW